MEQKTFESKIKPILLWMGTIVASVMAIAYVIVVFVLIEGFKAKTILNTSIFSLVTAVIGFCIMQMLKIQGQSFAKSSEENQKIIKQYSRKKTKDKKSHSLKYYWIKSGTSDLITKCLTLALTSVGMVYIMIEGNKDYSLLLLAGVNLLMFAGFGLISLVKAYDFYNESYVPYMLEKIEEAKIEEEREKAAEAKVDNCMEVAKTECVKERHDMDSVDSGNNILESGMDNSVVSIDDKSMVLDDNNINNNILGGTVHTSDSASISMDSNIKENINKEKEQC